MWGWGRGYYCGKFLNLSIAVLLFELLGDEDCDGRRGVVSLRGAENGIRDLFITDVKEDREKLEKGQDVGGS